MTKHLGLAIALMMGLTVTAQAETLQDSILAGVEKSESLMASRQGFVAARQSIGIATAGSDLSGTVSVTGARTDSDKKTVSGGFKTSNSVTSRIAISKLLFDSGEIDARVMAAEYSISSAKASYRSREQSTILAIIDAHLGLLTAVQARELQEENVSRLEAQTSATQIRLDAGTTTSTRLAEAKARLARAQSSLIAAQNQEQTAQDAYQSLTGLAGDDLELPDGAQELVMSLQDVEASAIANHPDMHVAKANERSVRAQFDVLARQVLPKVKFTLSATDTDSTGVASDKLDLKGEIQLTSPFIVTNGSRAKGKETYANLERAKYQLADTQRRIALNARSSWRDLRSSISQEKAVQAELDAALLVAEGIRSEVEYGQKIFLDQLDAEQSVSDAKLRMLQTKREIMNNHYRLLAAIGMLDGSAVGLAGQMAPIEEMQDARDVFTGFLPIADLPN